MYRVTLNGKTIHDPLVQINFESGRLKQAENTIGSFSFTIYDENPGYSEIDLIAGFVSVYQDGSEIYRGIIKEVYQNAANGLEVETAEVLSWLQDTIQRPAVFHDVSVEQYFRTVLHTHNASAPDKEIKPGVVTVTDPNDSIYRYTNDESTWDVIQSDLVKKFGGHLRIRYESDGIYLDYLADYPMVSDQKIEFGENLLKYSKTSSARDIVTRIIPRGAKLDETEVEGLETRLTIEEVNEGSDALEIAEAVQRYGVIERVVIWDDVHVPANLKSKAEKWLSDNQFERTVLELSAVDLADFGVNTEHLCLLSEIACESAPHGMRHRFPLTAVDIDICRPDANVYTLGGAVKSFTSSVTRAIQAVQSGVDQLPSKGSVVAEAVDHVTGIINTMGRGGHVVFYPDSVTPEEMLVIDTTDVNTAVNLWRWNLGGLAHSSNGYAGPFETAITMDGYFDGSRVVAHSIAAEQISVEYTSAQEQLWRDELGNNYWTAVQTQTAIEAADGQIRLYVDQTAQSTFDTGIADYYSKSEIDVLAGEIRLYAQQQATGAAGNAVADYYTKSEIDIKVDEITSSVEASITYTDTALGSYYSKSEIQQRENSLKSTITTERATALESYYTKSEIQQRENSLKSTITSERNTALGSYYNKSEIEQRESSLKSTITSERATALGSYYTKTQIDQQIDSISSEVSAKVGNSEFGTKIQQSATDVQIAWNNISNVIKFENAQLNIYNGSDKLISFNSTGMDLYYSTYKVGKIGTNRYSSDSSKRGLVFDLEPDGAYMAWAIKRSASDSTYSIVMQYVKDAYGSYQSDTMNFLTDVNFHNYTVSNADFYGDFYGYHYSHTGDAGMSTGSAYKIKLQAVNASDGTDAGTYTVVIRDGLIVSASS